MILDSWATYPDWHSEAVGERYTYRVAPRNWNDGWCELLITEGGEYVISLSCRDLSIAMNTAQRYEGTADTERRGAHLRVVRMVNE
jgi:hypothetical protein